MRNTIVLIALFTLFSWTSKLVAQEVRSDEKQEIKIFIDGKEFKIQVDAPIPPPPPPGLDSLARKEYVEVVKGLNILREMRPPDKERDRNGRGERVRVYQMQQAKLDSILKALEVTARHLEKEGDSMQLNLIHQTIGEVHRRAGAPRFAIESFEEVRKMAEKRGDWMGMAQAKTNIGATQLKNGQYEKALIYLEDALRIYQDLQQKKGGEDIREHLPALHNYLGQAYQKTKRYDEAMAHYEKSIELGKAVGDEETVCFANTYLGSVYQDQNQLDKAMEHYQASCEGFESAGHEQGKAQGFNQMGSLFLEKGDYQQAELYFKKGLAAAEKAQDKEQAMHAFLLLSKNAQRRGDSDQAYQYYQKYEQYKDSLQSAEREISMAIMEQRYDAEREAAELNRLEKERYFDQLELTRLRNSRNFAFAGTGLLMMLVFGIWQRSKYQREREQAVLEQQRVEHLEHLDKLKDEFLANTSHELRTPLNGIIGLAESLVDGAAGSLSPDAIGNLSMIATSGRRLNNLVNDILDFSKLKNNELILQRRSVDLRALTDVVLALSQPLLRDKDIALKNEIPADLPLADADENRVQQILHNLVGNALKFTETGSIRVWAEQEEDWLSVTVSDTGIGIPADKQDVIFQSFEQADGSVAREYGGTGIGLTVTKQLVELHGGTISVISEPGEGAHFTFTLPISEEERAAAYDDEPLLATVKQNGLYRREEAPVLAATAPLVQEQVAVDAAVIDEKIRILIVDDEPVNLQVLQNHLSLEGYEVVKAANGPQALEILRRDRDFDLIILDIMMPRMSGYEVCQKLRAFYPPSDLPIVMLTAKNRVADLVEGFQVGANDYLTKPFSKDELLSRIKTHLRLHSIHRASGKFVPFEFLRSIGRETITDVQLGDQTEKVVTVYFSDIRDYTTMSESMTPAQNFKFVNALNKRMGPIIRRQHGFVNQYLGDAIMAIFPDTPADALQAAIEMQKELGMYNAERRSRGREPIKVGIGMHTGPLIMGIIGDDKRLDAATISDTVNTASRIESLTKFYGANILLSEFSVPKPETTSQNGKDTDFHLRYLGRVQVKGKREPIGLYECFDGDLPGQIEHKNHTLFRFNEAMDLYFTRKFAAAEKLFREILQVNPDDQVARFFMNRTVLYGTQGVSDNWTGVETMASK